MNKNEIIYIPVEHIRPHPDNPRKNLGDISELSESIKKKGVMQNLTVIPGYWDEKLEWHEEEYTLIIGHRRYAAAKLAGLKELPCRVVDNMSKKDQVSTMLEENMQRNDLTIWEQANGFQMMLDLGETEDSIAEKTGFSRTTVRHRLNIAKLNQKVLQEKEKDECFQLSLKDLYELEKIPNVKTRDKILKESTSSNNLAQKAKSAVEELNRKEHEKSYVKLCKAEGIKPAPESAEREQYNGKWETVKDFDLDKDVKDKIGCKAQAAKEELFYVVWWRRFVIIKKKGKEKKQLTPEEIKRKEQEKNKREIKAMAKAMSLERKEFVRLVIEQKLKPESGKAEDLLPRLFDTLIKTGSWMNEQVLIKFFTGEATLYDKTNEEKEEFRKKCEGLSLLHKMMIYAAYNVADSDLLEWNGIYYKSHGALVMEFDSLLSVFGFSYSKEDFYKVAEGSYELYVKKEA